VQVLQQFPQFIDKLEIFRTEVLAPLDPVDKNKQAANAVMDDLLDSTVGLDSFVIPDIPISNTRAGLYVYLSASVRFKSPTSFFTTLCIDRALARWPSINRRPCLFFISE
jgi:hypothetical protein